jgi:succinoglycan biosynthesis protein ExoH
MVFNLGHIAAQITLRLVTGRWLGDDLFAQDTVAWLDSLFSIWSVPQNEPLHFLRELIVLAALSPIFGMLIRKAPGIGLVAVSLFFLTNTDGYLINRSDMPFAFYIGGLAAVYKWDLKALDKFAYPALFVFLAACAIAIVFAFRDITWLRLMAPFLIWPAASRLMDRPLGEWLAHLSKYSFFIYVAHGALMRMSWIFYQKLLPSFPVPLFTVIAPFAIVASCIVLYKTINRLIPRQLNWALGARGERRQIKPDPSITTVVVNNR